VTPHELTIPVRDLDASGKEVRFTLRAPWLRGMFAAESDATRRRGDEISATKDGELDLRVSKSGTDVVVHGTLEADLEVPCARCLRPAAVHVKQPLSVLMVPAGQMKHGGNGRGRDDDEGKELSEEEADVLPYDGDTVVLDDLVRDELVLAIPMIPLCSEACPGISPPPAGHASPEAAPAVDPRLAPLLKLKKDRQE
jgi:uncharacterized protein